MKELFAALPGAASLGTTGEQREARWREVVTANATWFSWHWHDQAHNLEVARRRVLARFRVLRLVLAFHGREALPGLVDPWHGAAIAVALDGEVAKVRAAEEFEGREWVAVRR